jgi:transcriptional regulator with XRE-family HTH domain
LPIPLRERLVEIQKLYTRRVYTHKVYSVKREVLASINRAFGERLRAAREAAGLTQVELAAVLDVAQKNVSAWESGKMPRAGRLEAIGRAVGVSVGSLFVALEVDVPKPAKRKRAHKKKDKPYTPQIKKRRKGNDGGAAAS